MTEDLGLILLIFGFLLVGTIWLLTPKHERRPLFKKSGKLYSDGDNT